MSTEQTAEAPDARSVLLRADVGVTPERVLALAWIRLAGQVAPPAAATTLRVTVLAPMRLLPSRTRPVPIHRTSS